MPERIDWAVELLEVRPADEILEFGCGPGVAVAKVCHLLVEGRITAIDRSATAIARAVARNAVHVTAGRAVFEHVDLASYGGQDDQFDKAFGVNVNRFWISPARAECEVLQRVLRPGGVLRLIYGAPAPGRAGDVAGPIAARLTEYQFTTEVIEPPGGGLVCITGWL